MAEINEQVVIDAVTLRLRECFPAANISMEEPPQDFMPDPELEAGAFVVRALPSSERHDTGLWQADNSGPPMGTRHRRDMTMEICYFPQDNSRAREECTAVKESLLRGLALIQTPGGDYLSGRNRQGGISDGVLVFTVAYPHFIRTDQPQPTMQSINFNSGKETNNAENE